MSDENKSLLDQLGNDGNNDRNVPTVEMTGSPMPTVEATTKPQSVVRLTDHYGNDQLSKPATSRRKGVTRTPMDLSQLPKEEDPNIKSSIQAEIFKPGGDFDQMIERREKEMQEMMQDPKFQQQAAAAAAKYQRQTGKKLMEGTGVVEGDEDDFDENPNITQTAVEDEDSDGFPVEQPVGEASKVDIEYDEDFDQDEDDDFDYEDMGTSEEIAEKIEVSLDESMAVEKPMEEEKVVTKKDPEPVYQDEGFTLKDSGVKREEVSFEEEETVTKADDDDEEAMNARTEFLKQEITKRLRPVSKKLDISGFPVAKRGQKLPTGASLTYKEANVAMWPLVNTGVVVSGKEIAGSMLELIRAHINNDDARAALKIMYDNITSAKPQTFDAWAKTVDAEDYDHLFFLYYIAAFKGANFIPIDCANVDCPRKVFITDDVPFIKMVNFHSEENKRIFNKIYKEEPVAASSNTVAYRIPISDIVAVDLRRPTLYSEYLELGYLNDAFIRRYADAIQYMRYIDEMYQIYSGSLIPIDYKVDHENPGRTVVNKVKAYAKAIRTLRSDELAILEAYIQKLNEKTINITYQRPETVCTVCGEITPAQDMTAASMVFIRNQLGLLTTT